MIVRLWMTTVSAVLGLVVLALAPAPAAAPDWTRVAARTVQGGIRVGNPNAPKRYVEIANYTCSHCGHFSEASSATVTRLVRAGRLSVEIRPIVNHQAGLAATIVARCVPERFLAVSDALYARQREWIDRALDYLQVAGARLQSYPELDQVRLVAQRGGIVDIAVAAGAPAPQVAACLASQAQLDDTLKAVAAAGALTQSTPTFLVGGKTYEGLDWATFTRQFGIK